MTTRRRLRHIDLCSVCRHAGGFHWSDDIIPVASRCPNYVAAMCGVCGGTGWDSRDPISPQACDHGATEATIAAAERADSARICPSHEWGYGDCRCTS